MYHDDLYGLGVFLLESFRRFGREDDIARAPEYLAAALELTPGGHPDLPERYANLGVAYTNRCQHLGEVEDLEKSIQHLTRALALTPNNHSSLPDRHTSIGVSYEDRYRRLGRVDDLKESIKHFTSALALTPDGHPSLPVLHANLGTSYNDQYKRLGQVDHLEKLLEHVSRALALTPKGHPSLPRRHADLGVAYLHRHRRLGQADDLAKSIKHQLCALKLTPDGDPALPDRHANLGAAYNDRYRRLGQVDDLEKSTDHRSRALALTPDNHPNLPDRHADIGVSYGERYKRLGQVEDLDKSTERFDCALALTPDSHPLLPERHTALGVSYNDRYRRLGQVDDLKKSIKHFTSALTLTPDGHPGLPDQHANLGLAYTNQFRRLGQVDDLEQSHHHFARALALTPDNHPSLPDRHAAIGISYEDRHQSLGQADDLKKSIEHYTDALALTPNGHPSLPDRHAALGVAYNNRYILLVQVDDLNKSTEHYSRALALTPSDHPDLPDRHFKQAISFCLQYQRTGDSSYMAHTLLSLRNASQIPTGSPRLRFEYAVRWASISSTYKSLSPIEAYQTAIDLLPQFIWLGATTHQRYQDLSTVEDLAIKAAATAILHSGSRLALEWLEHARCVVWNQSLMLRSSIEELHSSHPDLATHLRTIADQLQEVGSVSSAASYSVDREQIGRRQRRLVKEYEDLLVKTRMLPGFGDFLRPMKADRLVRAARNGPIAVINCHADSCDALLILPGQDHIQHVPLPSYTHDKAKTARFQLERSLRNKGVRERGCRVRQQLGDNETIASILLALWNDVVKPVLDFLGYLNNAAANSLPHVTWCPTGALSFLPLHAAGDYDQTGSRVFDYVVPSYAPTLTALLASTPKSTNLDGTVRILAISQEHTPGRTPLPGTARELECVVNHAQAKADYTQLTGAQATTAAVLDAMEKHDWVHLACHAHQNVQDPTKSGFFLHDDTLDLAAINRRSFKNRGLAFLSACQTATGDEKLPDEAIHLASGMLMAGYPSVIATMWSVKDSDAPLVADGVYAELMKDGRVGNGEAGRALHKAVGALRDKVGEKEFTRWVPYIHVGS